MPPCDHKAEQVAYFIVARETSKKNTKRVRIFFASLCVGFLFFFLLLFCFRYLTHSWPQFTPMKHQQQQHEAPTTRSSSRTSERNSGGKKGKTPRIKEEWEQNVFQTNLEGHKRRRARKKPRVDYGKACCICKRDHKACNGQRPCTRCIEANIKVTLSLSFLPLLSFMFCLVWFFSCLVTVPFGRT